MRRVEIVRRPTPAEHDRHVAFVEEIAGITGERPLSDHLWLDLLAGGAPGYVAVPVIEAGPHGVQGEQQRARAQVSAANDGRVLEVVTRPGGGTTVALDAADTAIDAAARTGGGTLTWWVDEPVDGRANRPPDGTPDHLAIRALAAEHGLVPARTLHEMRRPLPHPEHAVVPTRAFVPGVDDDEWLRVNNRAFDGHPEQGGWTRDTLAQRLAESWFDPSGFRLHEVDGRLAGFCWTKVHREQAPPIGEIYVIAVDPSAHGRGLGKQLTLAGLDSLSQRCITLASLYVDAANTAAVRLYRGLGFTVHRTRTALSGTLGEP